MKKKINFILIIVLLSFIFFFLQLYLTNKYLINLRSLEKINITSHIDINSNFKTIKIDRKENPKLHANFLISIEIENISKSEIDTIIYSNYTTEKSVDNYLVNYSNFRDIKFKPNSKSTIYLMPYFSECYFKKNNCIRNKPIFENFQIINNKNLIIKKVTAINPKKLPFFMEIVDYGQKFLISSNNIFILKNNFKKKNSIKYIPLKDLILEKKFKNNSVISGKALSVNKRINSHKVCSRKLNDNIINNNTISICSESLEVFKLRDVESKNLTNLNINGKLIKGTLIFILNDDKGEKKIKNISKSGSFSVNFKIDKNKKYFLNLRSNINVYNYPQIVFAIKNIFLYN